MQGIAGAAMLAALALPTAAAAPEPASPSVPFAPSHAPAAPDVWLAADRVYTEVSERSRSLDHAGRTQVARTILGEASLAGVDPLVILAIIEVESSFDPRAVSRAGAIGLMQLLVPTLREVAARSGLRQANPRDPVLNVQTGTRYFAGLVRAFGDVELALMAYNAGPNRIRRYLRAGGIPERFWVYPREVSRRMGRLRRTIDPSPAHAGSLLASAARIWRPALGRAHASLLEVASATSGRPATARLGPAIAGAALRAADLGRGRIPLVGRDALLPEDDSVRERLRPVRRVPRPDVPDRGALAVALLSAGAPPRAPRPTG
jgi:hypothetical protein